MLNWEHIDSGSVLGLLGEIDPLDPEADPDDLLLAQEYLLEATYLAFNEASDDWDFAGLQASLWDLAGLSSSIVGQSVRPQLPLDGPWLPVKDGDARARALFERHYSANLKQRKRTCARLFVGPGQKLVLLTPTCDALFVWRLERFRSDGSYGACCAVFRNESGMRSSELILAAEAWARLRWPFVPRLFTYVDPARVRSTNPGCCFKKAGWRHCGASRKGLMQFEKLVVPFGCEIPWDARARRLSSCT